MAKSWLPRSPQPGSQTAEVAGTGQEEIGLEATFIIACLWTHTYELPPRLWSPTPSSLPNLRSAEEIFGPNEHGRKFQSSSGFLLPDCRLAEMDWWSWGTQEALQPHWTEYRNFNPQSVRTIPTHLPQRIHCKEQNPFVLQNRLQIPFHRENAREQWQLCRAVKHSESSSRLHESFR